MNQQNTTTDVFDVSRKKLTFNNYIKQIAKTVYSVFDAHFTLNVPENCLYQIAKSKVYNPDGEGCFATVALELTGNAEDQSNIHCLVFETSEGCRIVVSNGSSQTTQEDILFFPHPPELAINTIGELAFVHAIKVAAKHVKARLLHHTNQANNQELELPQMPDKDITGRIVNFVTNGPSQTVLLELEDLTTKLKRHVGVFIPQEAYADFKKSAMKQRIFSWNSQTKGFFLREENSIH